MSETIGQQLKKAREARNLTLKKVTQVTHIQARLIEAMEADDFDSMPSAVQARAFLRIYAAYLGLNMNDMITQQRLGITNRPIAPPLSGLESEQSQTQKSFPDNVEVITPSDESLIDKTISIKERIKHLFFGLPQILNQLKRTSKLVYPGEESTLSDSGLTDDTLDEPIRSFVDESTADRTEELMEPNRISSGKRDSQIIFASIGEALKKRRITLSLTLDEIENHIHVRKHYLQALEDGDFEHLPSSVQARGMLNNYAHFLDMEVDTILLNFAEGLQIQRLERQPEHVENKRNMKQKSSSRRLLPGLRRYLSMDIIVGGGLVIFLIVIAVWGTTRVIEMRSATTPQPTVLPISGILMASPAALGTPTPVFTNEAVVGVESPVASLTPLATIKPTGQGGVQVVIVALEQAFLRVTVDGKSSFDGRISPGTAYPFDGNSRIEVLTGNGAAISLTYNQANLGPMGRPGEVVDRIYTAKEILKPTGTSSPTPTISPTPSTTPRQSPTSRPSSTPKTPFLIPTQP
jgi:cytoskeleton protein RodZ